MGIKVKIEWTVEIDAESWDMAYGTGTKPADVRADVRESARAALVDNFDREGFMIREVTHR